VTPKASGFVRKSALLIFHKTIGKKEGGKIFTEVVTFGKTKDGGTAAKGNAQSLFFRAKNRRE